jgi:hypothetical protein
MGGCGTEAGRVRDMGSATLLGLAVLGVIVAEAVAVVVVLVLLFRARGGGTGPLERIHRDYRQLTPAERQALLEFLQADLRDRP